MGNFSYKVKPSNDIVIAHYTPSIFPLVPIVNDKTYTICNDTWKYIFNKKSENSSGISTFYNDFYKRLASTDDGNKIIIFIENNCKGKNKIAEKGNIIIQVIKFVLDKKSHNEYQFKKLWKIHKKLNIDLQFYPIFAETLIYTISDNLDYKATQAVMAEWINLFCYIMQSVFKINI
jgi:hemoglobin-like flavoprotein